MLGSGRDCDSLIAEVEDVITSLTKLLQKATEVSAAQSEDKEQAPQALAVFAEEAYKKFDKLVASSFQAFEENDPRPHAREVQKQKLCKVIKE